MANICSNTFYASSENKQDIEYIINFFKENFAQDTDIDSYNDGTLNEIDIYFDSKWTFPYEIMCELFDGIKDKEAIYMRCLSVEYGCMYHALWQCDEDGWSEV